MSTASQKRKEALTPPPPRPPLSLRTCSLCSELLGRWERRMSIAASRDAAATSKLVGLSRAIGGTMSAVRHEIVHYERLVAAARGVDRGGRAASAAETASSDDFAVSAALAARADAAYSEALASQGRLDALLPALLVSVRQLGAAEASEGELSLREAMKRSATQLLQEAMPKFHALKRFIEKGTNEGVGAAGQGGGQGAHMRPSGSPPRACFSATLASARARS